MSHSCPGHVSKPKGTIQCRASKGLLKLKHHYGVKRFGLSQLSSFLARKILYEPDTASFDRVVWNIFLLTAFFPASCNISSSCVLFRFEIRPLDPISIVFKSHVHPALVMSCWSVIYLLDFASCDASILFSKGMVSSNIFTSCVSPSTMTRSGLSEATVMSAGNVIHLEPLFPGGLQIPLFGCSS